MCCKSCVSALLAPEAQVVPFRVQGAGKSVSVDSQVGAHGHHQGGVAAPHALGV